MGPLNKIQVTDGIFWVDAPDADLRILCGCPEDSVKHLIHRGLCAPTEVNGVTCETGPNAILLSDVMLQNGCFSNLGEFPVLQMLYKQGMLLPNHPNNTGLKPLLIGSRQQIQAQMEYIYRGNYGLISEEEIELSGGCSGLNTQELMKIKLQFAFGRITHTEDLLDTVILNKEKVEIRNGLFVQRTALNVFQFTFAEESVEIDLNLPVHQSYPSPYPLSFHDIRREYFAILHSGQGDGWDVNRPSMASILMFQGKIYLIDAGPNLTYVLTSLGIGVNEIHGIFQTHAHDDHFSGLTTLIRADHKIKFYATPMVRATVVKKLASLMSFEESRFSDFFDIHDLECGKWNDVEGLEVRPVFSPHPTETSIFMFRTYWNGELVSYGHFADIISKCVLKGMISDADAKMGVSQELYECVMKEYATPMTLKKIDIGGGLIHGSAEDFQDDASDKIILAHTSLALTKQQKEIGSSAPFGLVDVLIPNASNPLHPIADKILRAYFPTMPKQHLQALLNNRIMTFQAGAIMLRHGAVNTYIYLLLTGVAERIQSEGELNLTIASGDIIGEHSGMQQSPSTTTFRAISHVKTLAIPYKLYLYFVKQNKLFTTIQRIHENREFLQRTWLFGEAIAYPTLNRISRAMKLKYYYHADEVISDLKADSIYMIQSGSLHQQITNGKDKMLYQNDFFEGAAWLLKKEHRLEYKTMEASGIYEVPTQMFQDIPIVMWKLFEHHSRMLQRMEM